MWLTQLLALIPNIVAGVEKIHGDAKKGADKKTLALEALGLAVTGAVGLSPGQLQPAIGAAAKLAGNVIDGTVELFNKIGWPHNTTAEQYDEATKHRTWTVIK